MDVGWQMADVGCLISDWGFRISDWGLECFKMGNRNKFPANTWHPEPGFVFLPIEIFKPNI
jgi:hypothetical protein